MKELKIKRVHDIMDEINRKMDELYDVQMLLDDYESTITVGEFESAREIADELAEKGYPVNFEEDYIAVEKYLEENPCE